jgi:hypothetical protein
MSLKHHPEGESKRFKEYFFEFIMVFLAVTLGFFAENLRESHTERDEERQYARSFYEDLANDEQALPTLLKSIERHVQTAAELQDLLPGANTTNDATKIYVDFRYVIRQLGIHLFIKDRTLVQVRNAGGMRLLRNKQVTDAILDYYRNVDLIASLQEVSLLQEKNLRSSFAPLLNGREWDAVIAPGTDDIITPKATLHLRSADQAAINDSLLWLSDLKGIHNGFKTEVTDLKQQAIKVRLLIAQAYGLK